MTTASTTTTVATSPKDEAVTTISYVTTESTASSDKFADKDVEAVTVPTTSSVSEELPKGNDEETTVAPDNEDSEETNELFVWDGGEILTDEKDESWLNDAYIFRNFNFV